LLSHTHFGKNKVHRTICRSLMFHTKLHARSTNQPETAPGRRQTTCRSTRESPRGASGHGRAPPTSRGPPGPCWPRRNPIAHFLSLASLVCQACSSLSSLSSTGLASHPAATPPPSTPPPARAGGIHLAAARLR
jgi:hypothetical protein